jgi:flagellar protein FliL
MAKKGTQDAVEGGSKKKLIIIIAAVLLLLIGAGVGAYVYLGGEKDKGSPEQQQADQVNQGKVVGPMVNIDSFIVNILDDEQSRYLKAAITIEVDSDRATQEINQRLPQIKDAILLLIGNKTFAELNDLQGKLQLRAELINRINSILVNGKVKRIFFTDFVVQ